jgi:hypothetical protein
MKLEPLRHQLVWNRYYQVPWNQYREVANFYGAAQAAGVEPTAIKDLPLKRKGGLIMTLASGRYEFMMKLDNGHIQLAVKDDIWSNWRAIYEGSASQAYHWRLMAEALKQQEAGL